MHQNGIGLHGFTVGSVSLRGIDNNTVLLKKKIWLFTSYSKREIILRIGNLQIRPWRKCISLTRVWGCQTWRGLGSDRGWSTWRSRSPWWGVRALNSSL